MELDRSTAKTIAALTVAGDFPTAVDDNKHERPTARQIRTDVISSPPIRIKFQATQVQPAQTWTFHRGTNTFE
jgi:hypothetical protein